MGFISGTSTVSVVAKLTDAGKKKLYESIESNSAGFVTKFAIGDSDANYAAIEAGSSVLASGHVPEPSGFRPSIRSYALYQGSYRPGVPVVIVDGDYGSDNGITRIFSVGGNSPISFSFGLTTEWPKGEPYGEEYNIVIQNPGNISDASLRKLFTASILDSGRFQFTFNGNANLSELALLFGTDAASHTVVPVKIIGKQTHATVMYNIQVQQ